MTTHSIVDRPESTDALFDVSPEALARRMGERAQQLMRDGRDPFVAARLAASYAFKAQPALRLHEVR